VLSGEVQRLLSEIDRIAGGIGDDQPVSQSSHHHRIATMFDRCRGLFSAVRLLLDSGLVHEAAALCRPLFVESLVLAEIGAASEARRIELVVGAELASLSDIEGIFREMEARGDDDVAANIAHVVEQRRELETYARRHGVGTRHWEPNPKALADTHGRGEDYVAYRMTSHFVHGTPAVARERSSIDGAGVARVGGPAVQTERWETPSALFAVCSLTFACLAICEIRGYAEPAALEGIIERVRAMRT
jgi:Family of unknown function (DUF5677)